MNNAVYGKTVEDNRGHVGFELVDTPERMEKLFNAPILKHRHILNDNLVGVENITSNEIEQTDLYWGLYFRII